MNKIKKNSNEYNDCIIFIFTKDRTHCLRKSLVPFSKIKIKSILIDDSVLMSNQKINKCLCERYDIEYHGKEEQQQILSSFNNRKKINNFISLLGSDRWTIGQTANYSILLSRFLEKSKILFLDDDIIFRDIRKIDNMFHSLNFTDYVATNIIGMPDDSIVGHLYRAGNKIQKRYYSKSFFAFNNQHINNFFLNNYNEDWIWLFLERQGRPVLIKSNVEQMKYYPFSLINQKLISQELGEILWTGVYRSNKKRIRHNLVNKDYWATILEFRLKQIIYMTKLPLPSTMNPIRNNIIKNLLAYHDKIKPNVFANLFKSYYIKLGAWKSILSEVGI